MINTSPSSFRAFVDFPRDASQPKRRAVMGVLLALKMGQLRLGMTLNMMDDRTALEKVQQLSGGGGGAKGSIGGGGGARAFTYGPE